ncbi:MAG TPA: TetR/AcrR family transcriptional regulator C-terminal domain-containing protein [Chloroflexota bacterium]|nr:TetR/AcrR family transcriptional regulator C-terminal domain-containing protein [Chloroflexota bacterium]
MELADNDGIEAVTMRKLGQTLGVEAMSLYNHVANKDDLIYGLLDLVDAEIEVPSGEGDWKPAVRRFAISAHAAMIRHRWSCPLMLSTGPTKIRTARLTYMEGLLGTLRGAGFAPELTHHAYHAIESHIMGFTLWQVSIAHQMKDIQSVARDMFRQISEDEFPYTIEHGKQHFSGEAPTGQEEFAFGLDVLLDGIERLRDEELCI